MRADIYITPKGDNSRVIYIEIEDKNSLSFYETMEENPIQAVINSISPIKQYDSKFSSRFHKLSDVMKKFPTLTKCKVNY